MTAAADEPKTGVVVPLTTGAAESLRSEPWKRWEAMTVDGARPKAELEAEYGPVVDRAITDLRLGLEPADRKAWAMMMMPVGEWAEAFGLLQGGDHWKTLVRLYHQTLGDVPGDIVAAAFDTIIATWQWPRMPLPGDVRKLTDPMVARRRESLEMYRALARLLGRT